MLSVLMTVPKTDEEWAIWSLHHKADHDEIRGKLSGTFQRTFFQYQLDPIPRQPQDALVQWLQRNQQTHTEMNAPLRLQGVDLEEVNFSSERELQAWIYLHYQEHFAARAALKI